MAREIKHSLQFDAPIETVHAALTSDEYWAARIAEVGGSLGKLLGSSVTDGVYTANLEQTIRAHHLPALIQRVMPKNIKILRTESWGPIADGEARGGFTADFESGRASMRGDTLLAPRGDGSQISFRGSVSVNVPLVGRAVEGVVAEQLPRLFKVEDQFTSRWIASH